jgi:UDP-2-acetamido-2-deoxy-ribo-hexuluronate aminotransferase
MDILEDEIQLLRLRSDCTSVYAQYTIMVKTREVIQARLLEGVIPSAVHYPVPLNEQPAYKKFCCPDCLPVASRMAKEVLSLPMSPDLLKEDQDKIIQRLLGR